MLQDSAEKDTAPEDTEAESLAALEATEKADQAAEDAKNAKNPVADALVEADDEEEKPTQSAVTSRKLLQEDVEHNPAQEEKDVENPAEEEKGIEQKPAEQDKDTVPAEEALLDDVVKAPTEEE